MKMNKKIMVLTIIAAFMMVAVPVIAGIQEESSSADGLDPFAFPTTTAIDYGASYGSITPNSLQAIEVTKDGNNLTVTGSLIKQNTTNADAPFVKLWGSTGGAPYGIAFTFAVSTAGTLQIGNGDAKDVTASSTEPCLLYLNPSTTVFTDGKKIVDIIYTPTGGTAVTYKMDITALYQASIGDTYYLTLKDAVAAVTAGTSNTVPTTPTTINLLNDAGGDGINIGSDDGVNPKNVIINFNGHSYKVKDPVGSPGTVNQAFRVLKNSVCVLNGGSSATEDKTGTLMFNNDVSASKIVIHNYGTMTLNHMKVDGSNVVNKIQSTINANNGTLMINNSQIVGYASSVDSGKTYAISLNLEGGDSYGNVSVVIDNSTITGEILFAYEKNTNSSSASLEVKNMSSVPTIALGSCYNDSGYKHGQNPGDKGMIMDKATVKGTVQIDNTNIVASIAGTDSTTYFNSIAALSAAITASASKPTVVLQNNISLTPTSPLLITKAVDVDLNGHTISIGNSTDTIPSFYMANAIPFSKDESGRANRIVTVKDTASTKAVVGVQCKGIVIIDGQLIFDGANVKVGPDSYSSGDYKDTINYLAGHIGVTQGSASAGRIVEGTIKFTSGSTVTDTFGNFLNINTGSSSLITTSTEASKVGSVVFSFEGSYNPATTWKMCMTFSGVASIEKEVPESIQTTAHQEVDPSMKIYMSAADLTIKDKVKLQHGMATAANDKLTLTSNAQLTLAGGEVSNAGTLNNAGKLIFEVKPANIGTITNTGEIAFVGLSGYASPGTNGITTSGENGKLVWYASNGTTVNAYIYSGDASGSFKVTGTSDALAISFTAGQANSVNLSLRLTDSIEIKSDVKVVIPVTAALSNEGTITNAGTLLDQKGCTNAGTITNSGLFQIEKACTNNGTITNTGEIAFIMSPGVGYSIPGATGITTSGEKGAINWYNEAKAVSNLTYFIKSGESGSFKMTGTSGTAITTAFTAGATNQINLTVASGCTMSVANGVKVTVPAGKQLEVLGTLTNNGTVNVVGTLSDSYAINQATQMIVNDGTIEVAATGILKVGCNTSDDVNIDGTIIINAGGTFKNKTTGENILVANDGSTAIKLTEGSVKIVASDVGKAVDYTLSAGSKATIKESNAPGFGFKSDDRVTIDGELTADEMKIISGVKLTINGTVTVPASKSLNVDGTGAVTVSSEGKLIGEGTFDFKDATTGSKVLTVVNGGLLTTILDGSDPSNVTDAKESVMKLVGVTAGANGITVSKGSVVIDGTYTTDADGTITITSGTATITGTVDEGVKIVVPAGVTVNIPEGGTLEFDAGSSFENSGTIKFESKTSSTIIYEEGSTVNGVEIEVTTKQTEEGIIVAIIITLKTANADKLLLKVGGQYFEVFYVEAFEGDSYADALAGIEVESLKSRVSFDGWYNVLNEKVTSGMKVGSAASTLTAKFTETPREGVTPYTPSIEPTVITVDETGGYDNTTMLVAAVAMLVVAIFVLGYVVIVKRK